MGNGILARVLLVCMLFSVPVTASGCDIRIGGFGDWCEKARYEREVGLSAAMSAGDEFGARTHNGSIVVRGAEVADCNVIATIKARASSEEKARELAEKVQVKFERFGGELLVKIEKPRCRRNESVSVSLDVVLPKQSGLKLKTHNGKIKVANIAGSVDGETHNGKIIAEQVAGKIELGTHNGSIVCEDVSNDVQLETHNGSICCEEISGDAKMETHNGRINVEYSEDAASVCDVSLETHNGRVKLSAPKDFSAGVEVRTGGGSIESELPIKIVGKLSKHRLTGVIGEGEGNLYIRTYNGRVEIR